ncbi:hypothetical protein ACFL0T_04045 [Candidatus Omnitrophota bacterium]
MDQEAAKDGVLKNKYAMPLQEKLKSMKKRIAWVWMYVFIDGNSYGDALKLAKRFSKSGEANFLLEEFLSIKIVFKTLLAWFRQVLIFQKIKKLIPEQRFYQGLTVPEGAVFIKRLLAKSFLGYVSIGNILLFELYKKIFSYFSNASHCIYYTEMHAWEKALNAAKRLYAPNIKAIGFQHTGVSRNHFFYFQHPDEVIQDKGLASVPMPDILACNGDIPLSLMKRSGYPNLQKVEAIRHMHLNDYLNNSDYFLKDDILLIAGSISRKETMALISMFYEVFPKPVKFQVWLKGHPALPFEPLLKDLRIDPNECGYIIKHDPMAKLLRFIKVVIVGSSAVGIEALAGGCKVAIPLFSDYMLMSPLVGFEQFYRKVFNPQELRIAINEMLFSDKQEAFCENEAKRFIAKYWCLDESLKNWEGLLSEKTVD